MATVLFITKDPQGRAVNLTQSCYTDHILVEHPDLTDVAEIERTVRVPNYIGQDTIDSIRLIYYRLIRRRPERWLIKVVVENGEIVTAYRVKRLKEGERILWQR